MERKSSLQIEEITESMADLAHEEKKSSVGPNQMATPLPSPPVASSPPALTSVPPQNAPSNAPSTAASAPERKFMVYRDRVYMGVTAKFIQQNGLNFDGEVYEIKPDSMSLLDKNKHRFITNDSFNPAYSLRPNDGQSSAKIDKINQFLTEQGKIPSYLKIGAAGGKGLGVFAKEAIGAQTFLGKVEGMYRPLGQVPASSNYVMGVPDFDGNPAACLDTENMTFSNWGRFLNDSIDPPNCALIHINYSILVFAIRNIAENEELTVSYGDGYWNEPSRGKKM